MSDRLLNISRFTNTPTYTLSYFSIGEVNGIFMEPPIGRKYGCKRLEAGTYWLNWSTFFNPAYKFNFDAPIPVLYNYKTPLSSQCIIGHGNRSFDTISNNMLTGIWMRDGVLLSSVKTLKKLTEHLHTVGIENVTVIIS